MFCFNLKSAELKLSNGKKHLFVVICHAKAATTEVDDEGDDEWAMNKLLYETFISNQL